MQLSKLFGIGSFLILGALSSAAIAADPPGGQRPNRPPVKTQTGDASGAPNKPNSGYKLEDVIVSSAKKPETPAGTGQAPSAGSGSQAPTRP